MERKSVCVGRGLWGGGGEKQTETTAKQDKGTAKQVSPTIMPVWAEENTTYI